MIRNSRADDSDSIFGIPLPDFSFTEKKFSVGGWDGVEAFRPQREREREREAKLKCKKLYCGIKICRLSFLEVFPLEKKVFFV